VILGKLRDQTRNPERPPLQTIAAAVRVRRERQFPLCPTLLRPSIISAPALDAGGRCDPTPAGIEMYGDSIPAGTVGGDLFEYINFQQRYDIDGRIRNALKLSEEFLESLLPCPAAAQLGG